MSLFIVDLFSGTGSSTQAFRDAGHTVLRVELDAQHDAEWHRNVADIRAAEIWHYAFRRPDFIWASPPCTAFSVASIGKYWDKSPLGVISPKHPNAVAAQELVQATLRLIHDLAPTYWLMENPRGMLRQMEFMKPYRRQTVTYCQYGERRMKPTDLWGYMPYTWQPRPACRNGSPCHEAAPRGARTGTQGIAGAVNRSRVPYELSQEIATTIQSVCVG